MFDIGGAASDSDDFDSDDDVDSDGSEDDVPAKASKAGKSSKKVAMHASSEEDDDDDEEEDDESDDEDVLPRSSEPQASLGWGNRRSTFYSADTTVSVALIALGRLLRECERATWLV